jgi:hypothetical protein
MKLTTIEFNEMEIVPSANSVRLALKFFDKEQETIITMDRKKLILLTHVLSGYIDQSDWQEHEISSDPQLDAQAYVPPNPIDLLIATHVSIAPLGHDSMEMRIQTGAGHCARLSIGLHLLEPLALKIQQLLKGRRAN